MDTSIDLARVRTDTPGLSELTHLDHAGSSPNPDRVLAAVTEHLRREAVVGGYRAETEVADRIDDMYASIASLIGCAAEEVAFTDSATRSWDLAFGALALSAGDVVLTARSEYVSNMLAMLRRRDLHDVVVEILPDDEFGQVSVEALGQRLEVGDVSLVTLPFVPSQSGLVNPAADVGRLAREAGVPYLLDACQAVGQLRTKVDELGCDFLCATGRKFLRGPRGTGFLYVRNAIVESLVPEVYDTRSADWMDPTTYEPVGGARRFEQFERSVAGALGLGAAVDYALELGIDAIAARVGSLGESLRRALASMPGVEVHDPGRQRCGIVTFTVEGRQAAAVKSALWEAGIVVSVSPVELSRIDLAGRDLDAVVRASVHYVNTDDELARLVEVVSDLRSSRTVQSSASDTTAATATRLAGGGRRASR